MAQPTIDHPARVTAPQTNLPGAVLGGYMTQEEWEESLE